MPGRSPVGPNPVRLLRDALSTQECSTGAIVATCKFNTDAVVVAAEARKPPIELVDADRLADLALEYGVGVRSESVEAFTENLDAVFSEEVEGS